MPAKRVSPPVLYPLILTTEKSTTGNHGRRVVSRVTSLTTAENCDAHQMWLQLQPHVPSSCHFENTPSCPSSYFIPPCILTGPFCFLMRSIAFQKAIGARLTKVDGTRGHCHRGSILKPSTYSSGGPKGVALKVGKRS